jgi:hypothetical protein
VIALSHARALARGEEDVCVVLVQLDVDAPHEVALLQVPDERAQVHVSGVQILVDDAAAARAPTSCHKRLTFPLRLGRGGV